MSAGITTGAPAILCQLGINQTVLTAATTSSPQWLATVDLNGSVIVSPGTAVFVAGNIATLATFACSIAWIEEDV
jgi:hypothetical protein